MKVVIAAFILWGLIGSYGVYMLTKHADISTWWIVVYGLASIALFAFAVWRANKRANPLEIPSREDSV